MYKMKPTQPYALPIFLAKNIKAKIIKVINSIKIKSCFAKTFDAFHEFARSSGSVQKETGNSSRIETARGGICVCAFSAGR